MPGLTRSSSRLKPSRYTAMRFGWAYRRLSATSFAPFPVAPHVERPWPLEVPGSGWLTAGFVSLKGSVTFARGGKGTSNASARFHPVEHRTHPRGVGSVCAQHLAGG